MMSKDERGDSQERTAPRIDPATPPLKASELARDAGAADSSAQGGARDRGKVLEGHTHPDEIDIERDGDRDEPGKDGDTDYPGQGGDIDNPGRDSGIEHPDQGGDVDRPAERPSEVPPDIIKLPPD